VQIENERASEPWDVANVNRTRRAMSREAGRDARAGVM
jgi:hypothetical protein